MTKVFLTGRLTRDPEMRSLARGKTVTPFTVATHECIGHGKETAEYHAGRGPGARMGRQLEGATLGVIGYGAIGRRVAALGGALGMHVLVADPHVRAEAGVAQVALGELLERSDFVVCLAVATADGGLSWTPLSTHLPNPKSLLLYAVRALQG